MWTSLIEYVSPITTSSIPAARDIFARRLSRSGSLDGSAIWKRRIPWRATSRNDNAITSGSAGTQEMNRIPVVIIPSGVSGIASATSRIRSHGSSRWKRTDTARWVLEVKSSAW